MDKSLFFEKHIMKQFDEELDGIRSGMLEMGGKVEQQLHKAVMSLVEPDSELARSVIQKDEQVDEMELKIDSACLMVLAKHQPAARDLRLVVAITRAVKDLERVGDEAHNIAQHAIKLAELGVPLYGYDEIRGLFTKVEITFQSSLDAFARFDEKAAFSILKDSVKKDEYSSVLANLSAYMQSHPESINQLISILWVVRSLERVHDHTMNLCEQIVFLVQGKDIRHT